MIEIDGLNLPPHAVKSTSVQDTWLQCVYGVVNFRSPGY